MAANQYPIFPAAPSIGMASMVAQAAITARTNIVGNAGLTQLTPTSTNGKRIDQIEIEGAGTTVASILFIWIYDGTNSRLFDEIVVPAITPGNNTVAAQVIKQYANLLLPSTYQLYVSQTVQTPVNVFAHGGDY